MSQKAIYRRQAGLIIANMSGAIKRINETKYVVKSQNGNGDYDVCSTDLGWICSCPDHKFRGVKCKHIFAVEISFALHKEVEVARIEPVQINCCIYCQSSNIVKDGIRHNKYGNIQKFNCRGCNRYFTINLGENTCNTLNDYISIAIVFHGRIIQKCPEIFIIARCEDEPCCDLQMDQKICRFNAIVFRKNNTKGF